MNDSLKKALKAATVDDEILRAIRHAEFTIRKYLWSGFRPGRINEQQEVEVAGYSANDFVDIALNRLITGVRKYDEEKTLLQNINSATDSIIWSAKKSSDLDPTVDYALEFDENGLPIDPISLSEETSPSVAEQVVEVELAEEIGKHFDNLRNSFDGQEDVQDYLDALAAEIFDIAEIAEYAGVPVQRIYEIRRMLKKFAPSFFGVQNVRELERKVTGTL